MTDEIRALLERIKTEPDGERMIELVIQVNKLWDELEGRRHAKQRGTAA